MKGIHVSVVLDINRYLKILNLDLNTIKYGYGVDWIGGL